MFTYLPHPSSQSLKQIRLVLSTELEDDGLPAASVEDGQNEFVSKTSGEHRVIFINNAQPFKFCSNKISTAKYSFLSFIPCFLFEQFRRYSNCFFLLIALLQQIPDVSPTGRYTTLVPLVFILLVSAVKEMIEDVKRHKADREVNHRRIETLRDGEWKWIKWKEVMVGDIVKVLNNTFFPADLLVFATSEPQAMCYIETMNLDGETNLKVRQGLPETANLIDVKDLVKFKGIVECDLPNRQIYDFTGTLTRRNATTLPLGPDRILLRGAMLRNTGWVYGLVIYTGHETKLIKNSTSAPLKRSTIDKLTNTQILMLFMLLLILCLVSTICSVLWSNAQDDINWYLGLKNCTLNQGNKTCSPFSDDSNTDTKTSFGYTLLTFIILYNNLIPISLQVTLEVVRFFQAIFINTDIDMYHEESDTPAMARTSNLNEELGMVKYVFSDKTGTLTRNVMEFKHCSVGGLLYKEDKKNILVNNLLENHATASTIRHFLTLLSVCHTVIPEKDSENENKILYHASSPDERALLLGAQDFGFTFDTRTPHSVEINTVFGREKYEILNVLDFTSARKRMSVIVRTADDKIILYCKGADNVIFERLSSKGQTFCDETLYHLQEFANSGLRTLCCGMVEIPADKYNKWKLLHHEASTTLDNRETKLEEVSNMIEVDLHLLGATAVEDKLQDKVPETIEALLRADINVWVLTGDKQETAINIGYSTRLIVQGTPLIVLNETSLDTLRNSINYHITSLGDAIGKPRNPLALIIDGTTLKYALAPEIRADFLLLCTSCKSVICCRVSPMQKAEVVELVRGTTKEVTLAIGDGANDVAMIQKAHVGIGISGVEGLQAACASDYSIAQFHYLLRLLFVHGAWNYSRMCKLILYSFYKNICLYVMELWFAIYSGWSGQILFERWTIGLYNVLFTAAPPLAIGIFDKVCSAETMLKHPKLYSQNSSQFSVKIFWVWIINALLHSVLLFWIPMLAVSQDVIWAHAREGGYLVMGNMVYTYVVMAVCLKAGLHINSWNFMTHVSIWGSVFSWFVVVVIYSHVWPTFPIGTVMLGMDKMIFLSLVFWLGFILTPFFVIALDLTVIATRRTLFKSITESVRELEIKKNDTGKVLGDNKHSLSERARLLKNVRNVFTFRSENSHAAVELEMSHGFAFSQEEGGVVSQSDVVRSYDTKNK
ncbi:probable phospholipid-transporting ATPase IA isoform X3 [Planococcus citri]|uniref:probable phospholipid-transporting ATPase IA isoform X3 n=1 Tax=Planococcus citri TaxID=170843 RepID=UPI0031F9AF00